MNNPMKSNMLGGLAMAMAMSAMMSPSGMKIREPESLQINTKNLHLKTKNLKRKKVRNFYVPLPR
jgi:hypothetical protein